MNDPFQFLLHGPIFVRPSRPHVSSCIYHPPKKNAPEQEEEKKTRIKRTRTRTRTRARTRLKKQIDNQTKGKIWKKMMWQCPTPISEITIPHTSLASPTPLDIIRALTTRGNVKFESGTVEDWNFAEKNHWLEVEQKSRKYDMKSPGLSDTISGSYSLVQPCWKICLGNQFFSRFHPPEIKRTPWQSSCLILGIFSSTSPFAKNIAMETGRNHGGSTFW